MSITPEVPAKTLTQLVAMEIRVAMTRADIRQSELARRIGKTEQWLSVRLRGKQAIDLNDLALIASGLEVPFQALLPATDASASMIHSPKLGSGPLDRTDDPGKVPHVAPRPFVAPRRDSSRPTSTVPPSRRRPVTVRSSSRPMPR